MSRPRPRWEVGGSGQGGCLGPDPGGGWGVWPEGVSRPTPRGVSRPMGKGGIQACTEPDTPQQTATAAGSTHPTGMQSCFI